LFVRISFLTVLSSCLFFRAVSKISGFEKLDLNGNALCTRAVEQISDVMSKAKKTLGDLEDNDEDGDDDLSEIADESSQDEDDIAEQEGRGGGEDNDEEVEKDLADALKQTKI
jgi:Ran GTPase-activating protein (RanGAP) involved in mRNA processing and transport